MELYNINYEELTKIELITICKERGIKGYASSTIKTKEQLIKLLKGEIIYNNSRKKYNWSEKRNEKFKKNQQEKARKNNLFDYLQTNNPSIITLFHGNIDELKTISKGTMVNYKWKCVNYSTCSNIFVARPRDLYRNDSRICKKYCRNCACVERVKTLQKNMLEQNGSLLKEMPDIKNIWCDDNIFKPEDLTRKSHTIVKLKCPNKSARHPSYNIRVYNIQESNLYSCSKCSVKTSKAEMRIYSELKSVFKDVRWQQKIDGREADIIIEDLKLVVEIDGYPWHRDKTEKDLLKNNIFKENGYDTVRIRDLKLELIPCNTVICDLDNLLITDYNKIIEWINTNYTTTIPIYSEFKNSDYFKEIHASVLTVKYEDSLEYIFPESKELWDYEENYPFVPSQFTRGSHMKIALKCKNGHSYKGDIKQLFRFVRGKKHIKYCPGCSKST